MTIKKVVALSTAVAASALAGVLTFGPPAGAHEAHFTATMRSPSGEAVGTVKFRVSHHAMYVVARLRLPDNANFTRNAFHGFHIHANDDPGNQDDCQADPAGPPSGWFMSADGHLAAETGKDHGAHQGDLPSPLVMADGTVLLKFTTDRIKPADLRGRAVILHAKPDNFNNVPVGAGTTEYAPNQDAVKLTQATGNAGVRVACGVIRSTGWRS